MNQAAITVTANSANMTYGGTEPTFSASVTSGSLASGDTLASLGLAFTTDPASITGAGSYGIIPALSNAANYDVTYVDGTLTVNQAAITVTANSANMTYGGTEPTFSASVTSGSLASGDTLASLGLAFTTDPASITGAGSYEIIPALSNAANYDVTYVDGTLTVNRRHHRHRRSIPT